MGKNKNDDDVSEDGYDPGDDGSDDDAELFILETNKEGENQ